MLYVKSHYTNSKLNHPLLYWIWSNCKSKSVWEWKEGLKKISAIPMSTYPILLHVVNASAILLFKNKDFRNTMNSNLELFSRLIIFSRCFRIEKRRFVIYCKAWIHPSLQFLKHNTSTTLPFLFLTVIVLLTWIHFRFRTFSLIN